jgi:transcriptional regulator with XRE-family HTH domain
MMPKRPAATALRRRALAALVITERHRAGLRQLDVARMLGRPQSWVARIESDDRLRIDVIEFVALAAAIGFDPVKAVSRLLQRARARRSQPPPPRRLRRRR